jgi:hypothetical protein
LNVRKNSNYLNQTKDQVKEAAELAGISEEEAGKLIDEFFLVLRDFLNDERMPTFYVPYLGKFSPTLGSIRRSLGVTFKLYRSGAIPRDIAVYRVKKFWPIRQRLIKEKLKQPQHDNWKFIPMNWTKVGIKEHFDKADEYYTKGGKEEWDKQRGAFDGRLRIPKTDNEFWK